MATSYVFELASLRQDMVLDREAAEHGMLATLHPSRSKHYTLFAHIGDDWCSPDTGLQTLGKMEP